MPTKEDMIRLVDTYVNGDKDKMANIFRRALNSDEFNQRCKEWMKTEADRTIWQYFIDELATGNQKWNERMDKKEIRSD
jgi:hypothetical protein